MGIGKCKLAAGALISALLVEGLPVSAQAADFPTKKAPMALPAPVDTSPFYTLGVTFTGEPWYNQGGVKTGTDFMYGLDANLTVDLQKLIHVPNAQIYAEWFYVGGDSLDLKYAGAFGAPSALDTFGSMNLGKLYQLFYEQRFGGTDVLVGKYDVQTQFATSPPMNLFGNKNQAANNPLVGMGYVAGFNGGSVYPNTSLGVRLSQEFGNQWTVKLGVLDALSDNPDARNTTGAVFKDQYGALVIGEVDFTPVKYTKIFAGVWGVTGRFNDIGKFTNLGRPVQTWGTLGEYAGAATRIYSIGKGGGIDAFANFGNGGEYTSITAKSFDAGLTFTGLVPGRPLDRFGAAVFTDQLSNGMLSLYRVMGVTVPKYEYGAEFTYRSKITDWLVIQPELDYIKNPGLSPLLNGKPPAKSVFDAGLHIEVSKTF